MNIFYLSENPKVCAEQHVDKHVVKMIIEYAQLLSTAHRFLDGHCVVGKSKTGRKQTTWKLDDLREDTLYKATHINHPSAVWARASKKNYDWLYCLWRELMSEYKYRYAKTHATEKLIIPLKRAPYNIPEGDFTEPTPAMPPEFIVPGDSKKSYRDYYNGSKSRMFKWKNRQKPAWAIME
jgi:hypothetical protein